REALAHGAANRLADLDVYLGVGRRVNLVGGTALGLELHRFLRVRLLRGEDAGRGGGGHAVALRAEQPVDRLIGELAGDVPEGDVHRADRAIRRSAAALPEPPVEALAIATRAPARGARDRADSVPSRPASGTE